jgi:hypothetical protein
MPKLRVLAFVESIVARNFGELTMRRLSAFDLSTGPTLGDEE